MASIAKDPNGRRRILFVARDGKRKTIRLGKVSQRHAEMVKLRVEQLNAAAVAGHPIDRDTARWLSEIDDSLAEKLAKVGLVSRRDRATLLDFLDGYIDSRRDVKKSTKNLYHQTRANLTSAYAEYERVVGVASRKVVRPKHAERILPKGPAAPTSEDLSPFRHIGRVD